jgi:serine/threonine-protein kinase
VFAHSEISVRNRPGIQYKGKAHSLWYCDAKTAGEFHWYETAFMDQALMTRVTTELQPDSFDPGVAAANALSRALAEYQVAWPFTELVPGDLREFIDQWCEWFAEAADRGLPYPHRLPEHDAGSWR